MRRPNLDLSRLPRRLRLALYAVAACVLAYMTLAPTKDVPGAELVWDKAEHSIAWAVLTGAGLLLSTRRRWAWSCHRRRTKIACASCRSSCSQP